MKISILGWAVEIKREVDAVPTPAHVVPAPKTSLEVALACTGFLSRVARREGVCRQTVWNVANGKKTSARITRALIEEAERLVGPGMRELLLNKAVAYCEAPGSKASNLASEIRAERDAFLAERGAR